MNFKTSIIGQIVDSRFVRKEYLWFVICIKLIKSWHLNLIHLDWDAEISSQKLGTQILDWVLCISGSNRLYCVRSEHAEEGLLVETVCKASQLRSRTSLILLHLKDSVNKATLYVWHGAKASKVTKAVAVHAANMLKTKWVRWVVMENLG